MSEKKPGLFINIDQEEREMVDFLRAKGAVNISQLVRNAIRENYERLQSSQKNAQKKP
jgi:hypothetical protein